MRDKKLRQLMQEDLEREAKQIMDEVNSDPSLADVEVPQELHDKLFQQIREYEEKKEKEKGKSKPNYSVEDKELMRLGQKYKKSRKTNRLLILAMALITVFAVSMTSFGGPIKMVKTVKQMVLDRERTRINSGNDETISVQVASEEEAYQLIKDTFKSEVVRMFELPNKMVFSDVVVEEAKQTAKIFYEGKSNQILVYTMFFNYRSSSVGFGVDDKVIHEYSVQVKGRTVCIKQYEVSDGATDRWSIQFEEDKINYFINADGLTQNETDEIVKNLYFF